MTPEELSYQDVIDDTTREPWHIYYRMKFELYKLELINSTVYDILDEDERMLDYLDDLADYYRKACNA